MLLKLFFAFAIAKGLASPVDENIFDSNLTNYLSIENNYGAPNPPWVAGAHPGWYYGRDQVSASFPSLQGSICKILEHSPHALHCPKHRDRARRQFQASRCSKPSPKPSTSSDGYGQTFSNLTGATQAADYLTFGLVDRVTECKAMCNTVPGCKFGNTYHDVNGKNGSSRLTCSLFSQCHNASDATSFGGQTQPDGRVNYITNSDGWCKEK